MKIQVSLSKNNYVGDTGLFAAAYPVMDANMRHVIDLLSYKPLKEDGASWAAPFDLNCLDELHVTVMYSPASVPAAKVRSFHDKYKGNRFDARVTGLQYWGGHDGDGYVTLKILSPDLERLHRELCAAGAKPTFSPYKPHMTMHKNFKVTPEVKAWVARMDAFLNASPVAITLKNLSAEALKK